MSVPLEVPLQHPTKAGAKGTDPSSTYHQEYPLPTSGTTTVSVSHSRAPATTVVAPPQGVVSPVQRQPTIEVRGTTHQPFLGGSVNYASASLQRATPGVRQPSSRSLQCPPQEPPAMDAPVVRTPILPGQPRPPRPSMPYQFPTRYTDPIAYLHAAGRGRGVPRMTAPSQVSTPGAPQSQGNVTLGRGRGVPSQHGGTGPSFSGPSPGRTLGVVVTAESNPEGSAPRRASGSRRERQESPYKPYTLREPSMCKSEGWRKDTHRMYAFLLAQSDPDISAEEAEKLITPVLDHMWRNRARWYWLKEDNPLEFSRLLNDLFQEIHNRCIPGMDSYVRWIKPGSWHHRSVLEREELNQCPHLQHAPHPPPNVTRPSDATFCSYRAAFEKSLRTKKQILKNRRIYAATLRLHGRTTEVDEVDPPRSTSVAPVLTPFPAPPRSQQSVPMEVDRRESPPTSGSRSTTTNRSLPQGQARQPETVRGTGCIHELEAMPPLTPPQPLVGETRCLLTRELAPLLNLVNGRWLTPKALKGDAIHPVINPSGSGCGRR